MARGRLVLSICAILSLFTLMGSPAVARSATLEDSAKDLAGRIAAALTARENVSCQVRNMSTLPPGDVARVEQALKTELQFQGIRLSTDGSPAASIGVTLSENLRGYVWTGEIREGNASHVILLAVSRALEGRATSKTPPLTLRSQKFWEGPEPILDAGEVTGNGQQHWLLLLLPDRLVLQEPGGRMGIPYVRGETRDPQGKLELGQNGNGNKITFSVGFQQCTVDLDTRRLLDCQPGKEASGETPASRSPILTDLEPAGPRPAGKGTELAIAPVCGGAGQFLATGAGDYTQTDSVQAFQTDSSGPVAISAELEFPGPILALHAGFDGPRAILRNLKTGNYEAHRLSISCEQ